MESITISKQISVFQGRQAPEKAMLVGYGALIDAYNLPMPFPKRLSLISDKRHSYENEEWRVFSSRNSFEDTLTKHLVFSLKYEGINLLFFKKFFDRISKEDITELVRSEYSGQFMRKVWFLYEWMKGEILPIADLNFKNFVPLVDEELQYASSVSINSRRHKIKNNLPGTINFCPLIQRTPKLEKFIEADLSDMTNAVIKGIHKDILMRTSSFLLLKDSRASFTIEGENPAQSRAVRWGKAIGQAGARPLGKEEFVRLQQIIIDSSRFLKTGFRKEGGFVGQHERSTGEPIPDHISARWQDLETLMDGLLETASLLEKIHFNPVLTAAEIAFGFVFIHPFIDGNGRIHRYLIHHLLSKMNFTPQGIIFPVSAVILDRIDDYRKVLESYSHPLLDFIEWEKTPDNNVEVINETIDFYRYFDATQQAEFLFECVDYTISNIIPKEVEYLQKYDVFKASISEQFQMPDKTVDLLIRFLEQNNGHLSLRARQKEFSALTDNETEEIENIYRLIFAK